ncbi:MAG: shikimate kinase [Pseudomonadota bacterium]|nr:shikimate kinase [Pseudomonadota bacterium]
MPGVGKSTIGRQLSRRFGVPFLDADGWIEARIGCPIRDFFEIEGEARFREIETQVLNDLLRESDGVIATGGGAVLADANRAALRRCARCVYLKSPPDDLFRRLRHDTKRPLLQVADPLARLRDLFAQRDPLYTETAHITVETGPAALPELVDRIVRELERMGPTAGNAARS